MSGHSKWANIKHRKGRQDEKRGRIFGRMIREIVIAARHGGGNLNDNPRLRRVVAAALTANMPKDNIERAIERGTGGGEGEILEEITYGGFAPGGVAIMVEVVTDNKNRTTPEIRHAFSKCGGNLAETTAVTHLFERKGYFLIPAEGIEEDQLMELALEAGAEDMSRQEENFEIICGPNDFDTVSAALEAKKIKPLEAQISMIPSLTVPVEGKAADQVMRLLEMLEDHDDVQNVWSNFDLVENA